MMAETSEEWELSKENIQPIQQGRKQKALKVALAPRTEDLIQQQQQAFEHELRTYSGDDPLSIWCKYIKWVEQNFPKGGKDGHIKHLIEQCLSILKDEKKYYDDDRFIDILLKFANMNGKPTEVYNYMYSHNIGCKSANFFINWSWELEQIGNIKKADEVLSEGFYRKVDPLENIKSYREDFEIRLANKIKEGTAEVHSFESEPGRSAFTVLKPQKKNLAPVTRVGEGVAENKAPLILGRQQPQPKSIIGSAKLPFKIYDAENIVPSLPVQSQSRAPPILHTENYKENERKPSKWNKVKVRSHSSKRPNEVNLGFQFHCDEENALQVCTPRSVPKVSNILSVKQETSSPRLALFECPDPSKKPQYPKNKVYGGAVEFSLEEIRAAEWYDRKKKMDQEMLLLQQEKLIEEKSKKEEELQKQVASLTKQLKLLQTNSQSLFSKPCNLPDMDSQKDCEDNLKGLHYKLNKISLNDSENCVKGKLENNTSDKSIQNYPQSSTITHFNCDLENPISNNLRSNYSWTDTSENKCVDSTSYREAEKMVQELYNGTFCHSTDETELKRTSGLNFHSVKIASSLSSNEVQQNNDFKEFKNDLPFALYQDPTDVISNSNELVTSQNFANKHSILDVNMAKKENNSSSEEYKANLPFTFYQDPTEIIYANESVSSVNPSNKDTNLEKSLHNKSPTGLLNDDSSEEDAENIPPKGYIQQKSMRELAGVLEPSKNILFIPLEEQEELQDDSDTEDEYPCQRDRQQANETLIPPSNTEQFSADICFASTLCIPVIDKGTEVTNSEQKFIHPSAANEPQTICLSEENQNSVSQESANVQQSMTKPEVKEIKDSRYYPGLPNVLSTIMETSSENYSKSSSSSSSVNLTKSGQLDPSCHLSSVRKYSKLEICEPSNLSSVSEVPDSSDINSQNENIVSCRSHIMSSDKIIQNIQLYYVDFDPFDVQFTYNFIKSVNFDSYKNMYHTNKSVASIKVGENVKIGNVSYGIQSLISEGSYAKVYEASATSVLFSNYSNERVALKVCKNANEWEFYICCEMQKRLAEKETLPDVRNSLMNVSSAIKYTNGIVLVNEYCSFGTLLDLVNFYKKQNCVIPELIILYITFEILHIVSKLHEVNIIHGDIKPDNFLLSNNAFKYDALDELFTSTSSLRLIDFGRAIDLNLHPKGICFKKALCKNYFKCTEMKDNKPWVFQLDWYGVLSCIHTMLFSEYISVIKKNGKWGIEKKFKRYWYTSLWEPLFNELLNIPECYKEPDIKPYADMIKSKLEQNSAGFISLIARFTSLYPE